MKWKWKCLKLTEKIFPDSAVVEESVSTLLSGRHAEYVIWVGSESRECKVGATFKANTMQNNYLVRAGDVKVGYVQMGPNETLCFEADVKIKTQDSALRLQTVSCGWI